MMNSATKAANCISQSNYFQLRPALFHSTPVLERKRRNFWYYRSNFSSRKSRRLHARHSLLHAYADYILQGWENDFDGEDPSSSRGPSWFKKQYSGGSRRNWNSNQGNRHWGRSYQICEEEVEAENFFRLAFGGNNFFYWSFTNEENPQWRRSSGYSNTYRRCWRQRFEDDFNSSSESESSESDSVSDRLALELKASGPLKLEEVKNAYRTCALKWHPDRHQGSSKAVAEEKFKLCSAAYQSLCDKLAGA